ncbi:MAG: tRNA (adenosine(37)-N6)-threonylcarbamoyltransferase complex ATPase subunit type 1 TsaE [Rickettsiales bacterium]|jgi:tRNA threonylcarbamoyladenosine biosynthesis protein TsaE|nr:tRNA (adenosine(37)-N6)-threonylcarbamoyltransferase complex ATPase subunit type 1 TsaE [Rickettsiales bacterium]
MKNERIIKTHSLQETRELANKIALELKVGDVILLNGDLGAGKTYFATCVIQKLLNKEINVTSPTFNIVKEYQTNNGYTIYHFDLYRIKKPEELYELDIDKAFNEGISIIEWSKKAKELIYNIKYEIDIEILEGECREFKVKH